jgi:cell division protein FtsB
VLKTVKQQELAIEELKTANIQLTAEIAALKANPSTLTIQTPDTTALASFTHTDAA